MLGVLDRERVKLEDIAEDIEVVGVGLVEIEPEELPARLELLDGFATEVDLFAALIMNDVADRRPAAYCTGTALVRRRFLDGLRSCGPVRGRLLGHPAIVLIVDCATSRRQAALPLRLAKNHTFSAERRKGPGSATRAEPGPDLNR